MDQIVGVYYNDSKVRVLGDLLWLTVRITMKKNLMATRSTLDIQQTCATPFMILCQSMENRTQGATAPRRINI